MNTKLRFSTAYHSQTDGQSENTNQMLEIILRYFIAALESSLDWPKVLPHIQLLLNSATSASTGHSAHQLMYGMKLDYQATMLDPNRERFQDFRCRLDARECIKLAAMDTKRAFDRKHEWISFVEGDEVLVRLNKGYVIPADKESKLSPKLRQQYAGPYKVIRKVGKLAYEIDLPENFKGHRVLSVAHLEPCPKDIRDVGNPDEVAVDEDGVKRYEADRLIDHRLTYVGRYRKPIHEFRIRWTGYDAQGDWWIREDRLEGCEELVAAYKAANGLTDSPQ